MNELDRELVFSQSVKAGKRIYYFDVKQSRNGDRYISITESKKIVEGSYENPRVSFEKHKLFLYKEDYDKFINALQTTLDVAKTGIVPVVDEETPAQSAYANGKAAESEADTNTYSQPQYVDETPAETTTSATSQNTNEEEVQANPFKIDLDF